jgi:hypothetical protein
MKSHGLATRLMEFARFSFGFHGCCTSLQYGSSAPKAAPQGSGSVRHLLVLSRNGVTDRYAGAE